MRRIWQSWALTLALLVAGAVGQPSRADDSGRLLRLDHYVGGSVHGPRDQRADDRDLCA
jgi:hypothetical protein